MSNSPIAATSSSSTLADRDTSRVRPVGLATGTAMLIGAWVVAAAIARLTGATAVILILVVALVGFVASGISGWLGVRRVTITSAEVPRLATVGVPTTVVVNLAETDLPAGARLSVSATGDFAEFDKAGRTEPGFAIQLHFTRSGIVDRVETRIESAGRVGLIWWRRTTTVEIDAVHVAPRAAGPLLEVHWEPSTQDGRTTSGRGNSAGEIDGVRVWREGDTNAAIHWPSTLRTSELIVHDRIAASDTTWRVPFEVGSSPARLRWTLDEGIRGGHDVLLIGDLPGRGPSDAQQRADGSSTVVGNTDDSAYWAAELAAHNSRDEPNMKRVGVLHRPLHIPQNQETNTIVGPRSRTFTALAAFISVAMLLGALSASATMTIIAAAGITLGTFVSIRVARHGSGQPIALRIAIGIAALTALTAIAIEAQGLSGLIAALRGPMPDLLILLVVLHGFEIVDRRTLRVHQAITFVVAAYAAGLRIDGALGWWLAAWATAFTLAIRTTNRTQQDPGVGDGHRRVRNGVGLAVAAVAATAGILSIVPIPDGPARLGLPALSNGAPSVDSPGALAGPDGSLSSPQNTDATRGALSQAGGYLGFSETLDTSIRGDLGDELVMRVRSPRPAFWRGQTFTEFDGRTWRVSPEKGVARVGPTINVPPTIGDTSGTGVESEQLVQTYFIETDLPNIVFAASRAEQITFDGTIWTRPDSALRSDVTLTKGSIYTVVSNRLQVTPEILRRQGDLGAIFTEFAKLDSGVNLEPFLAIPASTSDRTIELARQLRTPGESTYDTIMAYQAWLSANTEYDLFAPVPAPGKDAVDDYLFESRRGFCEQIASSLAVMLRSQGVPARLATGYISGERDRVSGVWNVRASDAHSWVEVWFPQTGWEAFDPTASVPLAGESEGGTVGGDLATAAISSISSRPIELGLLAIVTVLGWLGLKALREILQRRRRGRWGVLQDRFSALGPDPETNGDSSTTNVAVADYVENMIDGEHEPLVVATALDRAAFDPLWVDDDEAFDRTRSAVATIERQVK